MALCDICRDSGNRLPTLAHLRQGECPARHVWTSDVDVVLEIVHAEKRRLLDTSTRASGRRLERMAAVDKARILDLVKVAASSHADYADLPGKLRDHFMVEDLSVEE